MNTVGQAVFEEIVFKHLVTPVYLLHNIIPSTIQHVHTQRKITYADGVYNIQTRDDYHNNRLMHGKQHANTRPLQCKKIQREGY